MIFEKEFLLKVQYQLYNQEIQCPMIKELILNINITVQMKILRLIKTITIRRILMTFDIRGPYKRCKKRMFRFCVSQT
jgi:hypothetical protein